jgi:lipopolysaccharide assembly outer membrane protein LptD (OstA)
MARDERNDAVQMSYRFTKDNIQELNFLVRLRTIKGLHVYGGILYNLLEGTRIENIYGAEYQAQCWTIGLNVQDINGSPTQKKQLKLQVYFNLLGIGSSGRRSYLMQF